MKTEIFGTIFKPNARWTCGACGRKNVSRLSVPVRKVERVWCKSCHRGATLTQQESAKVEP